MLIFMVEPASIPNHPKQKSPTRTTCYLVGGWTNPSEKYARKNGIISPTRDESTGKKYIWNHHLKDGPQTDRYRWSCNPFIHGRTTMVSCSAVFSTRRNFTLSEPCPAPDLDLFLFHFGRSFRWRSVKKTWRNLLMAEIRRSPVEVGSLSNYLQGFWTSQVVQNHNLSGLYPSLGLAKPTRKSQPVFDCLWKTCWFVTCALNAKQTRS